MPYTEVQQIIQERVFNTAIESILKINKYNPNKRYCPLEYIFSNIIGSQKIDKKTRDIFLYILYDSIKCYGELERKIGGYYQNHTLGTAMLYHQSKEHKPDIPGLIASQDHDIPEELVSEEIKKATEMTVENLKENSRRPLGDEEVKKKYSEIKNSIIKNLSITLEKEMITGILQDLISRRKFFQVQNLGMKEEEVNSIQDPAMRVVKSLTRLGSQTYYQSFFSLYHQGIFGIPDKSLNRIIYDLKHISIKSLLIPFKRNEDLERALTIRFCDALCNTYDLMAVKREGWDPGNYLHADTIYENLKATPYESFRKEYEKDFLKSRAKHPDKNRHKRLRGVDRLNRIFKNMIIINIARERKIKPKVIYSSGMLEQKLIDESIKQIIDVKNHLSGYHVPPVEVYTAMRETIEYEKKGGFERATKKSDKSKYDGMLEVFFDKRIRGVDDPLDSLDEEKNKPTLLRAAIGFEYIFKKYRQNPEFIFKGLDWYGLRTS